MGVKVDRAEALEYTIIFGLIDDIMLKVITTCLVAIAYGSGLDEYRAIQAAKFHSRRKQPLPVRLVDTSPSVLPGLHADYEDLFDTLVTPYIPPEQFAINHGQIERILMSTEHVPDNGLTDPLERLMSQLRTTDRRVAVKHFIKHNEAELGSIRFDLTASLTLFQLIGFQVKRTLPSAVIPKLAFGLYEQVVKYVEDRSGRCMYDYVPMEFRDTSKYDALFKEVASVKARPGDVAGIAAYMKNDNLVSSYADESAHFDSKSGIIELKQAEFGHYPGRTRYLNPVTGCACEVKYAFKKVTLLPGQRGLVMKSDDGQAEIWLVDSKEPMAFDYTVRYVSFGTTTAFAIVNTTTVWEDYYMLRSFSGEYAIFDGVAYRFLETLRLQRVRMHPDHQHLLLERSRRPLGDYDNHFVEAEHERKQYSKEQLEIADIIFYGHLLSRCSVPSCNCESGLWEDERDRTVWSVRHASLHKRFQLTANQEYLREVYNLLREKRYADVLRLITKWPTGPSGRLTMPEILTQVSH